LEGFFVTFGTVGGFIWAHKVLGGKTEKLSIMKALHEESFFESLWPFIANFRIKFQINEWL
jgi:hypothetical protein